MTDLLGWFDLGVSLGKILFGGGSKEKIPPVQPPPPYSAKTVSYGGHVWHVGQPIDATRTQLVRLDPRIVDRWGRVWGYATGVIPTATLNKLLAPPKAPPAPAPPPPAAKPPPPPPPPPPPKTPPPPPKAAPPPRPADVPLSEIMLRVADDLWQPIVTREGVQLAPGAVQAINVSTGKAGVLSAQQVARAIPQQKAVASTWDDLPVGQSACEIDAEEACQIRLRKRQARADWAMQRTAAVVRDPFDIGTMTEGPPVPRGRPGLPVPRGGPSLPSPPRGPTQLPAPQLPRAPGSIVGPAAAAGGAAGVIAHLLEKGCIPVCEKEKDPEQQRKARLPRKSCRQLIEEMQACPSCGGSPKAPAQAAVRAVGLAKRLAGG